MIRTFYDDFDECNGMYYTVLTIHREELETDEEFEKKKPTYGKIERKK